MGCLVSGAKEHGYLLTGGKNRVAASRAKNIGLKAHNTYAGCFVDTPFGNAQGNELTDFINEWDDGNAVRARFGYQESSFNGGLPGTFIRGGRLNGVSGGASPLIAGGGTVFDMVKLNNVLSFYSPVVGPGSLPGSAVYRDASGFLKTV